MDLSITVINEYKTSGYVMLINKSPLIGYMRPSSPTLSLKLQSNCVNVQETVVITLSEQIAHSTVDLHLKENSEFLHGSVMNKNVTLQ